MNDRFLSMTHRLMLAALFATALPAWATYDRYDILTTTVSGTTTGVGAIHFNSDVAVDGLYDVTLEASDSVKINLGGSYGEFTFNQRRLDKPSPVQALVATTLDMTPDPGANAGNPKYEDLTSPQGSNVEGLRGRLYGSKKIGFATVTLVLVLDSQAQVPLYMKTYEVRAVDANLEPVSGAPLASGKYGILNQHAIPEPGAIALLLAGIGAFWVASRLARPRHKIHSTER